MASEPKEPTFCRRRGWFARREEEAADRSGGPVLDSHGRRSIVRSLPGKSRPRVGPTFSLRAPPQRVPLQSLRMANVPSQSCLGLDC